ESYNSILPLPIEIMISMGVIVDNGLNTLLYRLVCQHTNENILVFQEQSLSKTFIFVEGGVFYEFFRDVSDQFFLNTIFGIRIMLVDPHTKLMIKIIGQLISDLRYG